MLKKALHIFLVLSAINMFYACDMIERIYLRYSISNNISIKTDSIFRIPADSVFLPDTFDRTGRLFYLCKVWGFVKYYSENNSPMSSIDIDQLLFDALSESNECNSKEAFTSVLLNLITSIQKDPTSERNPYKDTHDYALTNFRWMNDTIFLNETIREQLHHIFLNHSGQSYFIDYLSQVGNIMQVNEKEEPDTLPNYNVRLLGLFRYWNVIHYFYPNKYSVDGSWDRILYESIPHFEAADTEKDYRLSVYRLIRKLRDMHNAHNYLTDPIVSGQYRPNFNMLKINDEFIISKFLIPNEESPFQKGDRVIRINGKDAHLLYDSLRAYVGGGNYWAEQSYVCTAMMSDFDSTSTYTVERGGDTLTLVSTNRKRTDYIQYRLDERKQEQKKEQYKWINDSVAYLNLKHVTRHNFTRNYSAIRDAKIIILDLRCYPDNMIFFNCISTFVPPTPMFAYAVYPDIRFPGMLRYRKTTKKIGKKNGYQGKIILLVDEWTESFTEYLAMALQTNPRTVTVGRSSSGADGNISKFKFPGNIHTFYTGIGIYYPDFTPTQRCGVKIDYFVEPTTESLRQGNDLILEQAKHKIKNRF